jgi:hypothetical protein
MALSHPVLDGVADGVELAGSRSKEALAKVLIGAAAKSRRASQRANGRTRSS